MFGCTLVLLFIGVLLLLLVLFDFHRRASQFDLAAVDRLPQETRVVDGSGRHLGYLHGEHVGDYVGLDEVSPYFLDALIAREDSRFHRHRGIDHLGLVRAWVANFRAKRLVQGGSTITMQLARMTYGLRERSMERKLLEMAIARRIERRFTKEEILHRYVNRIFLGTGMNGIGQAARGYFGKTASELNLAESAMVAGIIRAPNGFSPFRHPRAAEREMRTTLDRMVREGYISRKEASSAAATPPEILPQERWMEILRTEAKLSGESYLLDMVDAELDRLFPSLSAAGGLTVETTFDVRLQRAAESALERGLSGVEAMPGYPHPAYAQHSDGEPRYLQGALAVIENESGALRALVGGRNPLHSAYNRALHANRQVGSVFKPFVYATAFEVGLLPGTWVSDARIEPGEIAWGDPEWAPTNADGTYGADLPAELGLIRSRNTMTIRVGEWAGIDTVLTMMEHAGFDRPRASEPVPSLYLGSLGASVLDLASAYTIFATGGVRHEPHFITRILDRDGNPLYEHLPSRDQVVSPGAAWVTSSILRRVVEQGGTGAGLRRLGFLHPAGGKTGTTDRFHDAWFAGYTSRLSATVWVGLDQPETVIEGAYGGAVALPIWSEIMTRAAEFGYPFTSFAPPGEILPVDACRVSGRLPVAGCRAAGCVYEERLPPDLIPRDFCRLHDE